MLSRVKELDQLFILGELPEEKIYPIPKALEEMERLEKVCLNNNPSVWDSESTFNITKICFLNARSIKDKFANIISDYSLQQSDVIILAETWLQEQIENNGYQLKNFHTHLNSSGRGKGIAVYHKDEFQHNCDQNEVNISITKIDSKELDIIAVYRSKDGSLNELIEKLQGLIDNSKTTLVIGDMNICNMDKPKNVVNAYLTNKKFKKIVMKATHIDGGHIDHGYLLNRGNFVEEPEIEIVSKYYSDHDAICISPRKIIEQAPSMKK